MISARELAWAAGLFEGEGSIWLSKNEKTRMSLTMTDEDSVRRFAAAVRVGNISGPRLPKGGRKEVWQWNAGKFEHVQAVVAFLWYGLGVRRRAKCIEVLKSVRYAKPATHCRSGKHRFTLQNSKVRSDRAGRECRACLYERSGLNVSFDC
jgi:hypothetical protein